MTAGRRRSARGLAGRAQMLLHRAGFDIRREQFKGRFVATLVRRGVQDVLDIGANTGQFGLAVRRAGMNGRIVSLEPLGSAFAELCRRAEPDPRWQVERAAVSDASGTVTVNVAGNSVSSSLLPMLDRHALAAPQSRYVATEEVASTTVDELVARYELDPGQTLLKIDVQGYERSVLEGASRTLDRFAAVRTELSLVPLYDGQALIGELLERLGGHGFDLWFIEPGFSEPSTQRLLQLDGTFFRRSAGDTPMAGTDAG